MRLDDNITDIEYNRLYQLAILANVINCWDFFLDKEQISNDELMKALDLQNQGYLEKILKNQEYIMKEINDIKERMNNGKN